MEISQVKMWWWWEGSGNVPSGGDSCAKAVCHEGGPGKVCYGDLEMECSD